MHIFIGVGHGDTKLKTSRDDLNKGGFFATLVYAVGGTYHVGRPPLLL